MDSPELETVLEMIREGWKTGPSGDWRAGVLKAFEPLVNDPETRISALGHRAWLYRTLGMFDLAGLDYQAIYDEQPSDDTLAILADTIGLAGDPAGAAGLAVQVLINFPLHPLATRVLIRSQQALGVFSLESAVSRADWFPGAINPVLDVMEKNDTTFPSSIYREIGRLIYWFVRSFRPKVVVETGSFIGYSSLYIGQGLKDNGDGFLHSFDLFPENPDYISPVIGPCADGLSVARAHADRAGLTEFIDFHRGDSSTEIERFFTGKETGVDLAFIDGDHRIRGCLKDWKSVDRIMNEGGIILLHDTIPETSGWLGPRYLIEKLKAEGIEHYQCINIPTADGAGLGIVQKKLQDKLTRLAANVAGSIGGKAI